jgi:hypothetical protein
MGCGRFRGAFFSVFLFSRTFNVVYDRPVAAVLLVWGSLVTSADGSMFVWLINHQLTVLFSQNKPATSNHPAVLFSQNKSAPVISHQLTANSTFLPEQTSHQQPASSTFLSE